MRDTTRATTQADGYWSGAPGVAAAAAAAQYTGYML